MKYDKGIIKMIIKNNGIIAPLTTQEKKDLKKVIFNQNVVKLNNNFIESVTKHFTQLLQNTDFELFKVDLTALTFLDIIVINEKTKRALKIQYCRNNNYKNFRVCDANYSLLHFGIYIINFESLENLILTNC